MRTGSFLHIVGAAGLALVTASSARADSLPAQCFDEVQGVARGVLPANAPAIRLRLPMGPEQLTDVTLTQIVDGVSMPMRFERTHELHRDGYHAVLTPDDPFVLGARLVLSRSHCGNERAEDELTVGPPIDFPAPPGTLAVRTLGVAFGGGVDHYELEVRLTPASGSLDVWAPYLSFVTDVDGATADVDELIFGNVAYAYTTIDCRDRPGIAREGEQVPVSARIDERARRTTLLEARDEVEIDCDDAVFVAPMPNGVRRPLTAAELAEIDPHRRPFEVDAGLPFDGDGGTTPTARPRSDCAVSAGESGASAMLMAWLSALALVVARRCR